MRFVIPALVLWTLPSLNELSDNQSFLFFSLLFMVSSTWAPKELPLANLPFTWKEQMKGINPPQMFISEYYIAFIAYGVIYFKDLP